MVNLASLLPRAHFGTGRQFIADLADEMEQELAKTFPPVPLIERDRIEAESRFAGAGAECERLQVELLDLETHYERRREELVADLANARQAASAAAIWAQALHPGAMLPANPEED